MFKQSDYNWVKNKFYFLQVDLKKSLQLI
jgi:hypothetical protein